MKTAIDKKLCARQAGGQVILTPDVFCGAREHSFGVGSVAAQFPRQAQDSIHIGTGAIFPGLVFQTAQGFARQILNENYVFFMSFVARR